MTTTNTEPIDTDLASEDSGDGKQDGSWLKRVNFEITPKKINKRELMQFSRQMAVFIRAGIPILEALSTIRSEVKDKFFGRVLDDIIESLNTGSTLAGAVRAHRDAFPAYYLGILETAELTGELDVALVRLSAYIERDVEARRRIVAALTYPIIVVFLSIIVVVVLVSFVLPRFKKFFDSLNATLPLPTRILLAITNWITNWWFLLVGVGVIAVLALLWMWQTERGKQVRDRLLLRLPVVGDLIRHAVLERFCRVFHSMVATGVPLPEALTVTAGATNNRVYEAALLEARASMLRGQGLAGPLAETGLFPASANQMLRVGEATGSLDEQLAVASEYFEQELDYRIKRFTNLFEPAVIVFVGLIVGFVAIALVSAMYGIYNQVHV
jgi:type IV pilus assembly protein PilC